MADRHGAVAEHAARTAAASVTRACSNRRHLTACGNKKLLETTADDFFAVFKDGKVSIVYFLKRLHNFAVILAGLPCRLSRRISGRNMKPKTGAASRRTNTKAFWRQRKKPSGNCFWNCFGKPARRRATPRISKPRTLTGRAGRFPISEKRPARWRSSPLARRWKRC